MTKNQLQYAANQETARSNRAKESEQYRSNTTNEREAERSNKAREYENWRSNTAKEKETKRSNKAGEKLKAEKNKIDRTANVFSSLSNLAKGAGLIAALNDPAWYNNFPELVQDTGSIPYNGRMSQPVPAVTLNDGRTTTYHSIIPGIHTLVLDSTIGVSPTNASNSPLNKAARYVFSKIQSKTSYNKDYDQSDVMLYLLAISNAYGIYHHIRRAYEYAFLRSPKNDYLGPALATAQGFDWTDLKENLPALRSRLNLCRVDLEKFFVPSNLAFFNRAAQLFTHIYKDGKLNYEMDELYFTVPGNYYVFRLDTETSAGMLENVRIDGAYAPDFQMSVEEWLTILETQISAIISNGYADFMMISGDIEKVFDTTLRFEAPIVVAEPSPVIYESVEIAVQFMNAFVTGTNASGTPSIRAKDITQTPDTGDLVTTFDTAPRNLCVKPDFIIRSKIGNMTPLDNIVATRWMPVISYSSGSQVYEVTSCGTELPVMFRDYYFGTATGEIVSAAYSNGSINDYPVAQGLSALVPAWVIRNAGFEAAPANYCVNRYTDDEGASRYGYVALGNFEYWGLLPDSALERMHDAALRSLFYIQ